MKFEPMVTASSVIGQRVKALSSVRGRRAGGDRFAQALHQSFELRLAVLNHRHLQLKLAESLDQSFV